VAGKGRFGFNHVPILPAARTHIDVTETDMLVRGRPPSPHAHLALKMGAMRYLAMKRTVARRDTTRTTLSSASTRVTPPIRAAPPTLSTRPIPSTRPTPSTDSTRPAPKVVVGLDTGGTSINATVLDASGDFLVDQLVESPSHVQEGPGAAVEALAVALDNVLALTGTPIDSVRAVGLGTPGPASAFGVMSSRGSTNFAQPSWHGFDFRGALEARLSLPVAYINDANAAALYAHYVRFGEDAGRYSAVSLIVGTGLGGGVIVAGHVVRGAAGMAGELGHVQIPLQGLLEDGQPVPVCNCGLTGDAESVASLTGIEKNLLPYWLTRYEGHELGREPIARAAKLVRSYGERGDALALKIFEQQAIALGRLFTIAANVCDPDAYFLGGGVVETAPDFRTWFLAKVRENMHLRREQAQVAIFDVVPALDMAGARGAALEALDSVQGARSSRGRTGTDPNLP
jgi:glucokinase